MTLSRRQFLAGLASAAVVGCTGTRETEVAGGFVDRAGLRGHRPPRGDVGSAPARRIRVPVVVVGAGIAGLAAAWWMDRAGFRDFVVLELDDRPGGNAAWGRAAGTPHPWAGRSVRIPPPGARDLRALFRDLGVLRDGRWDETARVHAPAWRLFRWGRWHRGLEETLFETDVHRRIHRRFRDRVGELREAGAVPGSASGGPPPDSPLDRISMARWLEEEGFRLPALRWLVDHRCRDEFGAGSGRISAWAGVHSFATDAHGGRGRLAWPEGTGWIARRLAGALGERLRTGRPVRRVEERGGRTRVVAGDVAYECDAVVWAAPSFVASRVVEGAPAVDFTYSPWLTATLTVEPLARPRRAAPAWMNVRMGSPSVGYLRAGHQTLRTRHLRSVWTWYRPLDGHAPAVARQALLRRSWSDWKERILADLEPAHPRIRRRVSRIDVYRMGHAVPRPTPGFLSSPARRALRDADGPVFYAHSDVSGLPLFGEAFERGVAAARGALRRVGRGG